MILAGFYLIDLLPRTIFRTVFDLTISFKAPSSQLHPVVGAVKALSIRNSHFLPKTKSAYDLFKIVIFTIP